MGTDFVYLASASPRRRELLHQIGVPFRPIGVVVDEAALPAEEAPDYVVRLAVAKASAGWQVAAGACGPLAPVLGADTAVVLDGRILGKPKDRDDAVRMVGELSGRTHAVLTAVALCDAAGAVWRLSRSEVRFRDIDPSECAAYADSGEPLDKAGGYAIQGFGAVFVELLAGSYSGVMGLPIFETAALLRAAGVPQWCAR
ncbi:MAG: Maf family protein [Steroidobacterales bacterium]